ncbi:Hypothetical predicted protein, partial [Olea europaea subsp. europaea]
MLEDGTLRHTGRGNRTKQTCERRKMRDEIAHHVIGIIEPMRSVVCHFQGVHLVAAVAEGKIDARTKIEVNAKLGGEEEGEPKGKVAGDDERRKYYRVNNLEGSEVNVFDQLRAVLSNNCNDSLNTFNMSDTVLNGWQ